MSKQDDPSLFEIATALSYGFHALRLMHVEPHYVRVVLETQQVAIDVIPYPLLARAQPYKATQNASKWKIIAWWEDAVFSRELTLAIHQHALSFDKISAIRLDNRNGLVGKVR